MSAQTSRFFDGSRSRYAGWNVGMTLMPRNSWNVPRSRVIPPLMPSSDSTGVFPSRTSTDGAMPTSLENLVALMRKVAGQREARCALVIDFASRLTRQPDHLDANEHRFFVAAERISLTAHPIVPRGADIGSANGKAHFNPVLWLVNRGQDLPSWLALDSTRVSVLTLSLPDYETRLEAAQHVGNLFAGYEDGDAAARRKFAQDFAQMTDGLTLVGWGDRSHLDERTLDEQHD